MEDTFSTYHPIINFCYFAVILIISMFFNHPVILGVSLISAIIYAFVLQGWKKVLKFNFLFMLPMLIIVALINPLFNHAGVTILFYLQNGNPITLESIIYGLVMSVMLVQVMIWFSCYNIIMTSDKFIYLFGRIIPALSLIFSMVLRFIPKFKAQLAVISNGQKCIGRDISNGNILMRARHGVTILSIMVTWALENAIETADSMKARGYGLRGRTAFSLYRFDKRDKGMLAMMLVLLMAFITGVVMGNTFVQYNPTIIISGVHPITLSSFFTYFIFGAFCLIPVGVDGLSYLKWKKLEAVIPENKIYHELRVGVEAP
ncbi:energy-coupling factor transporter transmembrane protein EcfT [Acetobacterium wieringae]|uniref:Energy-coupling factor transporter transmembrane protein EcfT n=1 Tax=Acetobacterium wieringae TaxID=52694 RepID=A0A5D0WJP5_9FIRM|nr:energy-coupling factor transporter transmembrane component T [Acetobacterium wieringae]TYC84456.1 energy-coupling factor transporter transmembrane protein EcfT [Acetobacterium wieringae]UYO63326.1 energy-coupling factor transporter transmembrane protein EcfT [Acetobacterium wieringae]VUZ24066.1 Energy-coupling factor transporter transmembrane protein EcfT [Acetobacterium wieringae]